MAHDPSDPKNHAAHAPDPDATGDGDHLSQYGMRSTTGADQEGSTAQGKQDASAPRSGPDQAAYHRSGYGGYGGGPEADAAPSGIEAFDEESRVREARNPTPRTLPTGLDADPAPGTAATKPHTARK